MSDLTSASGVLKAHDKALHGAPLIISHCSHAAEHPLVKERWKLQQTQRDFGLLVISAELGGFARDFRKDIPPDVCQRLGRDIPSLVASYAVQNLMFEVNTLFLIANVLRPSGLTVERGFAFVDQTFHGEVPAFFAEDWHRAIRASKKYGWPSLEPLSVVKAWLWLESTACIDAGIARHSVGRALAALSYVAQASLDSESSLNLAWVLLGLEALYCTGSVGLREQLVAKSELVLGRRVENKKAFGAMYDFRSRFLHGDMDLPLRYSEFNAVPDFERHYVDLDDHEGLALAVLISTLQTMIRNDWRALNFHHALSAEQVSSTPSAA